MQNKKKSLANFSQTSASYAYCLRPESEKELANYLTLNNSKNILARGAGLSYNDSCLNSNNYVIDTTRFNHLISFDAVSGLLECQAAVTFKDLLVLHKDFIPPVVPGTIHATLAGGIAHDVHGKNNHREGSLGQHLSWFDLLVDGISLRCSKEQNSDLFEASIAGLGLTGIITRVGIYLKKASRYVQVQKTPYTSIEGLMIAMSTLGLAADYQVAWLDLLQDKPRGVLALASHCDAVASVLHRIYTMPKTPFCLLKSWNLKLLNSYIFNHSKPLQHLSFAAFNNPLDAIRHWNRCYGTKGLIQFQAVFPRDNADIILNNLLKLIKTHQAIPTLAVLKLFTQNGTGLLSFCRHGFTIAIDFLYETRAKNAIMAMNQYVVSIGGSVYLAKDLLINKEQFAIMYPNAARFKSILAKYNCQMQSDLANRIGLNL